MTPSHLNGNLATFLQRTEPLLLVTPVSAVKKKYWPKVLQQCSIQSTEQNTKQEHEIFLDIFSYFTCLRLKFIQCGL